MWYNPLKGDAVNELIKAFGTIYEKSADNDKGQLIIKYAQYNDVDKDGDLFLPNSIKSAKDSVVMSTFNHGTNVIGVGKVYDGAGSAFWEGELMIDDDPEAAKTFKVIKRMGPSQEFSWKFHFDKQNAQRNQHGGLDYKAVTIFETSPVFVGAGNSTGVVAMKRQDILNDLTSLSNNDTFFTSKAYSLFLERQLAARGE